MTEIRPIAPPHAESFRIAVDTVARESGMLAAPEGRPLADVQAFIAANIGARNPHLVALDNDQVVGWCDITRAPGAFRRHCGRLGMGVLAGHRGHGLGRRLLRAALDAARAAPFRRIELTVRADNASARHLYETEGFIAEGRFVGDHWTGETYRDTIPMALHLHT